MTDFVGYVGDTNGNLKKKQKRKFDEENWNDRSLERIQSIESVSTRRIHFHIINAFVYTTYTISYNVVLL